jgi:threonine synthase
LRQALRAIRESGGTSIAVTDASIIRWQKLLAAREGIFAEPTSAAAFAGLQMLTERGIVGRDEVALVPVTGFGLKDALPS